MDLSFGVDGGVLVPTSENVKMEEIAVESSDNLIVTGIDEWGTSSNEMFIVKYNSDGINVAATTYTPGTSGGYGLVIDSSGNILVAGDSTGGMTVWRYTQDLALDTTFGTGGVASHNTANDSHAGDLAIDSSGNIVVAAVEQISGITYGRVLKFDSSGNLVTSFGTNGMASVTVESNANYITTDSANNIYLSGSNGDMQSSNALATIRKFDSDGNVVSAFGSSGTYIYNLSLSIFNGLAIDDDGRIFVTGGSDSVTEPYLIIAAIDSNSGEVESDFGADGIYKFSSMSYGYKISFDIDGRVIASGFVVDSAGDLLSMVLRLR